MGVLNNIKDKIFGGKKVEEPVKKETTTVNTQYATTATTATAQTTAETVVQTPVSTPVSVQEPELIDVEAILEAAVSAKGIKLNWRQSIVDLMKALDLDSSLAARKELAADLKYSGTAADGSAEKNMWLHKELMKSLAENGGKVPKELLS